jgi:hypothetical protein
MFETLRRHPLLVLNQAARDPLDTLAMLQENSTRASNLSIR